MLLLDAFDLTYEMASMTEESIEEHTINGMDIMVDHFMNQQLPKHFFIQIGYCSIRNSGSDLQRSEPEMPIVLNTSEDSSYATKMLELFHKCFITLSHLHIIFVLHG